MKIKIILSTVLLAMGSSGQIQGETVTIPTSEFMLSSPAQTIDGFGASDAWSMRYAGLWPEEKQTYVADKLFSRKMDNKGNPVGIGLSIWRFNVGAGSEEQGDDSMIKNAPRRTECFLLKDGTYDWSKQRGQQNFLKLAKERGVPYFIAFLNSPPVYFTKNGKATNHGREKEGGNYNLKADKYDDFAGFIVNVLKGVKKHTGVNFNYISPVNEPDGHWNWTGQDQEGTPATNREIATVVRTLSPALMKAGLKTKILIDEASDYRCLLGVHQTAWDRGFGIRSFFSPDSVSTYVGNLPNVLNLIGGHTYWTTTPLDKLKSYRQQIAAETKKQNIAFWQTEYCVMGNDTEIGGGGGYDRTMKTALYVARIIHHDLVYANARSWQWWRALGGDYKDGLMRVYDEADPVKARVEDSKLLWAFGNYTRFIRPGAVRYNLSSQATDPEGLMVSVFKNKQRGQWVIVVVNYASEKKSFSLSFPKTVKAGNWKLYRTSDKENLSFAGVTGNMHGVVVPARTVTTFVSE